MKKTVVSVLLAVVLAFGFISYADEGMWLLDNLPLEQLKNKYDFVPAPGWLENVQKSSARLPNCSTSFVSESGLLMTNWHCSEEAVKALSTPQKNYYADGFYARTFSQELKTNLNARVLMSMTNVTQRINDAVASDKNGDSAKARQEAISQIQRNKIGLSTAGMLSVNGNVLNKDPFICEVVVLYQGGQYHNYCYRVYDDIRLVFMPEQKVGFFGGDADNFEYPRYTLDVSFLRAYENGKPAKTLNHFKWPKFGAKEGELIFVSGHPGRTARMLTSSALATERDIKAPFLLDLFRRRELTTQQFILRGKKEKMIAESDLFSWQNSRKLYVGKIRGLQDSGLLEAKKNFEKKVVSEADPATRLEFVEGLLLVKESQAAVREIYPEWILLARGLGFDSELFGKVARISLSLAYEEYKLRDSLTHLIEVLGADSQTILTMTKDYGSGPVNVANKLVYDPAAIVQFAKFIVSEGASYEQKMKEAVEKERQGYSKISSALFRLYGTDTYPDATFTLRLSFGTIKGQVEGGRNILPLTTIGGAYKHSVEFGNQGDYKLPVRWWNRKQFVNLKTPLNFVSDLDITGGNSGSPVFNRNLEIVGLVFDSNIYGLVSDYDYNYSPQARAIAVHSAGIIELLRNIYRADRLVEELTKN